MREIRVCVCVRERGGVCEGETERECASVHVRVRMCVRVSVCRFVGGDVYRTWTLR